MLERNELETDSELGAIYSTNEEEFSKEEDTAMYPQLAKDALSEVKDKNIEVLQHHELSETLFVIMRGKNPKVTRAEVYRQKTQWLKKALTRK